MRLKHMFFVVISSLIFMSEILHADNVHAEDVLTEDEVRSLISGNTLRGIYLGQKIPFESYFNPDGTVYQNRDGESREGEWFVDKQGKHCVKWVSAEPKCRVVMRNNDEYIEFTINKKTGKRAYTVIINKIIKGYPEDL